MVIAIAWRWIYSADGMTWTDVRVALGSVAATPIRANATEAALDGAVPDAATADRAMAALMAEIHPIDDVRSTAEYRRFVLERVVRRMVLELS